MVWVGKLQNTARSAYTACVWHIESQGHASIATQPGGVRLDDTIPRRPMFEVVLKPILNLNVIPHRTLGARPMIEAISATLAFLSGGIFLAHILNAYRAP